MRRYRKGNNAKAISDRSGFAYPMEEMIIEPGTGWLVHHGESDGMWNLTDHPLNHVEEYVNYGDPFPVEYARPEQEIEGRGLLGDESGLLVVDSQNNEIYTRKSTYEVN